LAGCGTSDEAQVASAVERFYRAAAHGDGKEACEQLTPAARAPAGGLRCEPAIDQLGSLGGVQTERRLAAVEIRGIKVSGDRATAEAQIPTQTPATIQLEKVPRRILEWQRPHDEWRIASLGPGSVGVF
jgi:hypothetical protein